MATVDISINASDTETRLPQFQRALSSLPSYYLDEAVDIMADQMRQEIPKGQSGKLEGSVTGEVTGNTGIVQTNAGYGKAVDEGRRGFDIYGHPFLRFFYMGKIIFARKAHPGPAPANNFKQRTITGGMARITPSLDGITQRELTSV